jgi:hypothetical protein
MSDYPTVDRVIADLKRLAAEPWNTDREREIGNAMVDARHCLVQLVARAEQLQSELADAKKWAMAERSAKWQALSETTSDLLKAEELVDARTVSEPGAALRVTAVPIPPKIQAAMAEAIRRPFP